MLKHKINHILNDPAKSIPNDIIEQFFIILKTGDIEQIKKYVAETKIKYNVIDINKFANRKSPIHVILELDEKIADNPKKYRLIKFLALMGAPLDTPDNNNVRPIHLAAQLQDKKIINFFIDKNVSLNVSDSSNNSPLHYAVIGKEISCPKKETIKSLIPKQNINNMNLNLQLEKLTAETIKVLKNDINVFNIINTINKIPNMYEATKYENNVNRRIDDIKNEFFLNKNTVPNPNKIITALEQLIKSVKNEVINDVFNNAILPLDIQINNTGWGLKVGNGILPSTKDIMLNNIELKIKKIRESININNIKKVKKDIKNIVLIGINYFNIYLFCDNNPGTIIDNDICTKAYAFYVSILKIFFLLELNYYKTHFYRIFNDDISNMDVQSIPVITLIKNKSRINYCKVLSDIYDKLPTATQNELLGYVIDKGDNNSKRKDSVDNFIKEIPSELIQQLIQPLNDEYLYELLLPPSATLDLKTLIQQFKITTSNWDDNNTLSSWYNNNRIPDASTKNFPADIKLENIHDNFNKYIETGKYNDIGHFIDLDTGIDIYSVIKDYLNKYIIENLNILAVNNKYSEDTKNMKIFELYSAIYCDITSKFNEMIENISILENIIININKILNIKINYFIPQALLPLFIININEIINNLYTIISSLDNYTNSIYNYTILEDQYTLFLSFSDEIRGYLITIYANIIDLTSIHNKVIELLNFESAINLLKNTDNIFNKNLTPIGDYPQNISKFKTEKDIILNNYKIPNILYYNRSIKDIDKIHLNLPQNGYQKYDKYGKVISNSFQINIKNDKIQQPKGKATSGTWIYDTDKFSTAYIGYITKAYNNNINSKIGVFPSIKSLGSEYIIFEKYSIIEDILSNGKLKDVVKETLKDFNDDQKNVIVAKIIDSSLNNIIDYAILNSVTQWIKKIYDDTPFTKPMPIFRDTDFLNIYLNGMDTKIIKDFLESPLLDIRSKLSAIEHNINNIPNTSIHPYKFVHYVYDTNYYTDTKNTYATCYKVNPRIFEKLITPKNLYMKNAEGYTPLHLAIIYHNSKIVDVLMKKYKNLLSFTDNYKRTPHDLILDEINLHINFLKGNNIKDIYHNLTIEFNDILVNRLNLLKFNNNMLKNITYGIPIFFVMYNHMFNLYLRNYRYNFTIEIKNEFDTLSQKYFHKTPNIYPTDIFELPKEEEEKLIREANIRQYAKKDVAEKNKSKIDLLKTRLEIYNNQILELNIEKVQKVDKKDIDRIDNLIKLASKKQLEIQKNIDELTLTVKKKKITKDIARYNSGLDKIRNSDRIFNLTEFYKYAFDSVSKNNILHIYLWKHYLHMNIENTPSMIFILINLSLNNIIRSKIFSVDLQLELSSIRRFLTVYKKYVDLRESLPENLEENYILESEFNHIVYLINLLITDNVISLITNNIYEGLLAMELSMPDKDAFFKNIISIKSNDTTIMDYLRNVLPLKIIKYFTTIYNSDIDIDKKIISANEFFIPIINIIKNNGYVIISDDAVIIQNFKNQIIPFLINTYQSFISSIRIVPFIYEKYLLNTYQLVEILANLNL